MVPGNPFPYYPDDVVRKPPIGVMFTGASCMTFAGITPLPHRQVSVPAAAIRTSYHELSDKAGLKNMSVAVRSSATAEDLRDASSAAFLNISGEKPSWAPDGVAKPRSLLTGPSATAGPKASTTLASPSRSERSAWSTPMRADLASCSPSTQRAASTRVVLINAAWGASASSGERQP